VYEIDPTPAGQVVERFKTTLGLGTVRAYLQNPDRPVTRLGAVWGGVGLVTNLYTTAQTLAEGVDMVVGGETDETAAYFFAEAGVDVVELGHQRSEIDGLAKLAPWLNDKLGLPVAVYREETPLGFY
jgi:putative NIF3 family GTP cyclohydrolase 1 type 2